MAKKGKTASAAKSVSDVVRSLRTKTNAQFWELARKFSPSFASHTAEATKVQFDKKGFEQITLEGTQTLNEFFEISMRVAFQLLNISRARNPLVDKGLIQVYDTPNGGYIQRMAVHSIKPVSPKFKNLKDGDSIDPFVVRKPKVDERFFEMNFDYQNLVTIQEYQLKTMFINEFGMGELLAGILEGMANGYTIQEYLNAKECINAALNSTKNPLRETQKVTLDKGWYVAKPSHDQMTDFILALKDTATRMTIVPQTGMYNAMGFESVVNPEDHVLLIRAGARNAINTGLMVGAFNPEYLTLPFEIVEVDNFGGLIPATAGSTSEEYTEMSPLYSPLGEEIGFFDFDAEEYQEIEVSDETATLVEFGQPKQSNDDGKWYIEGIYEGEDTSKIYRHSWKIPEMPPVYIDPNESVLAVIMQKGAIFETAQNPYQVTPIFNPRGLYTNYIASRPNTGINYDALYDVIVFYAENFRYEDDGVNVHVTNTITASSDDALMVHVSNAADDPVLTQEITPSP